MVCNPLPGERKCIHTYYHSNFNIDYVEMLKRKDTKSAGMHDENKKEVSNLNLRLKHFIKTAINCNSYVQQICVRCTKCSEIGKKKTILKSILVLVFICYLYT